MNNFITEEKLAEIKNFIENNFNKGISVKDIADKFEVNVRDLRDQFYCGYNKKPKKYMEDLRAVVFIALALEHNDKNRCAGYYRVELGYKYESELHNFLLRRTGKTYLDVINIIKKSKTRHVSALFESLFKS